MILIGRGLSADELRAVLEDPAKVDDLLYGDLDDDQTEMPEPEMDLGKSWHGIHYLLTGTAWEFGTDPAGAAILGGDEIGEDGGYGPARLVRPEAVRTIAAALDGLSVDALRARYDPQAMEAAAIYPSIWTVERTDELNEFDDFLVEHFIELRRFYQTAAAGGQAVLLAIT